jgi:PPK2 family polyphosphate:nucleotide phosphotransferase
MTSRTYPDEQDRRRSVLDKNGNPQDETTRTRASSEAAVEDSPEHGYPRYRIEPGERASLAAIDPNETEHYRKKKEVVKELEKQRRRIQGLQARLYAENERGLLIVLQAMDTGGKDGTIKHVFSGVNPQGCRVSSFKTPSAEEANHDFLWRYHKSAPARGRIGIFNRSHYEDVLVVRVKDLVPDAVWRERYHQINDFERNLSNDGITVLKFFLHISKDEQKRRLQSRLENPDKRWKFSSADIKERAFWDDYQVAFEDALTNCSTEHAPWYVVPANKKWYRNLVIARTIADTLAAIGPQFPPAEEGLELVEIPD